MGRSGTSLMASYLNACGINMGMNMLGGRFNNKRGHFEDLDFLNYHKRLLADNRADMFVPKRDLVVSDQRMSEAWEMVGRHSQNNECWGWKDPRTSLFLDMWGELLPDAKFIFMYRDPYEVMRSLYRTINLRYVVFRPWVAPACWLRYNRDCLEFFRKNPGRCAFVNISGLNRNHADAVPRLAAWLGCELKVPYTDVYHPEDMGCSSGKPDPAHVRLYLQLFRKIYGASMSALLDELDGIALVPSAR
jgi:hypothetical protein